MATKADYTEGETFGILSINSQGDAMYIEKGKDFTMKSIYENIDTGDIYYDIEVEKLGKKNVFRISKTDATDIKQVQGFVNQGLDVNSGNARVITEIFQQKEDRYIRRKKKVKQVYSEAGVKKDWVYAGEKHPLTQAEYIGHLDLSSKGDKETWYSFVKEIMQDSVEIMFAISVAFSAILLGYLRGYADLDNIIVHLRGNSSSGKTTMLNLVTSVFANPRENCPNGLISSWNGTKNAILRKLMNVNGMLFGLDEFSMMKEKDVSSLIYSICAGIEKDRLRRDASIQKRQVGTYIVFSTGESSILSKCNGNIGLSVRVLEFDSHQWSKDAKQSEIIKKTVKEHYGFAATDFGVLLHQWLQEHDFDALLDRFEECRNFYCKKCTIQARKERMSSRYGLILLGAALAKDFFDMPMNMEKLCQFIIDNENDQGDDHDSYNGFYEKLVSYLISQNHHFAYYKEEINNSRPTLQRAQEEWGLREEVKGEILIDGTYAKYMYSISVPYFDKIVKELGYEDSKAMMKFLKEKGYSYSESDRITNRKTLGGVRFSCITIFVPGGEVSVYNQKQLKPEQIRKHRRLELLNRYKLYNHMMDAEDFATIYCELENMENELNEKELKEWKAIKDTIFKRFHDEEGMANEDIHNHAIKPRKKKAIEITYLDEDNITEIPQKVMEKTNKNNQEEN